MRIAIVLAGEPHQLERVRGANLILAADGGANGLHALRIRPHMILGDMDSISKEAMDWCMNEDVEVDRHPQEKDETDGELALRRALARDPEVVEFYGVAGGRTAMQLVTLELLVQASEVAEVYAFGDGETWRILRQGNHAFGAGKFDIVAVSPSWVRLTGTAFDADVVLSPFSGRTVSNQADDAYEVHVEDGIVLHIERVEPDVN